MVEAGKVQKLKNRPPSFLTPKLYLKIGIWEDSV